MYYNAFMDTTIRNLDEGAYRSLKARAALAGKTVGEMVNEAIRAYLARPDFPTGSGTTLEKLIGERVALTAN